MITGTYVGSAKELQGKTALLQVRKNYVAAQFDDRSTGYGLGWHFFDKDCFVVDTDMGELTTSRGLVSLSP